MGAFITNCSFKIDSQEAIVDAIRKHDANRSCFVSPALGGWVTVYDDSSEGSDEERMGLCASITRACKCPAIAFRVADSDSLEYWVFDRDGTVADKSELVKEPPSEAEARGLAGDPKKLVSCLQVAVTVAAIRRALNYDTSFRDENLGRLAELLGIANSRWSYWYLHTEGAELAEGDVIGWKQFVRLGSEAC
jgi:hypothetical protein